MSFETQKVVFRSGEIRMIENEIIKTPYGNIAAYKQVSGKKTILLLHGAGCDSTMLSWKEVFHAFPEWVQ